MAALPAVAEEGASAVMAGPVLTVSGSAFETRFPGLVTVTGREAGWAITAAGTVTVICAAASAEGCSVVLPTFTVAPVAKPAPLIVRVNAGPAAVTAEGESEVSCRTETVSASAFETTPARVAHRHRERCRLRDQAGRHGYGNLRRRERYGLQGGSTHAHRRARQESAFRKESV